MRYLEEFQTMALIVLSGELNLILRKELQNTFHHILNPNNFMAQLPQPVEQRDKIHLMMENKN